MKKAFTLIEILVVVVIITIIVLIITAIAPSSKRKIQTQAQPNLQNFTITSSERILYPYFTYVHVLKDNETNKEYILVVNDSIGMTITPKLKKEQ